MQEASTRTILYLIRHGQTDYNASQRFQGRGIDAELNEVGRKQAEAVARYFEGDSMTIDRLYCSSLKRTAQTAGPLAYAQNLQITSSPDLDEMDFGSLEGAYVADHLPYLRELQEQWRSGQTSIPVHEGEHPEQVYSRANEYVHDVVLRGYESEGRRPEKVVLVVHGRLIRILLSVWLGYGLEQMDEIEHSNGAIYEIGWDGRGFTPIQLHITEHLA
ncbi:MAG: histidine phosphatase family protein [Rhodothermaeota bacterium MED-G12]|nr:MAG: histidine phosphatase family protein [Rhodothermaeota bacterium MED-G12]CAI8417620.1 MAG: Putative phosphoserine phosphatase 2 [Rhodothermaeota bacterium MED-G12]|tara:strand:+ start:12667 stop:13317 length:651 start_codon:yes stop_codon:yes gene_type:complete